MKVEFFVPGSPAPGGSKRFVGFGKSTGRAILVDAAGQKNKDWRAVVGWTASEAMARFRSGLGPYPPGTALVAVFEFVVARPKGHFTPKGQVRPTAPKHPTSRPDALKLTRSTEDALTGIVWHDDSQIVSETIHKRFASPDEATGARITVYSL